MHCVDYDAFVDRNRMITGRLIKQGFRYSMLCKTFKIFSRKHRLIFKLKTTYRRGYMSTIVCNRCTV